MRTLIVKFKANTLTTTTVMINRKLKILFINSIATSMQTASFFLEE